MRARGRTKASDQRSARSRTRGGRSEGGALFLRPRLPRCPLEHADQAWRVPARLAPRRSRLDEERAQADLYRLLSLAEERGATLDELEVRRPSLEDIFLELTRKEGT